MLSAGGSWSSVTSVGGFISPVKICLNELMLTCALWRSLFCADCCRLLPAPQPVHVPLDNWTPMSCLPDVPLVCFLVASLAVIRIIPTSTWKTPWSPESQSSRYLNEETPNSPGSHAVTPTQTDSFCGWCPIPRGSVKALQRHHPLLSASDRDVGSRYKFPNPDFI